MSELQDALDWVDSGPVVVGAKHIIELAKAARMWLNPNIEAAARLGVVWDELTEKERVIRMAYVKPYVMAALTRGDTDGR